MAAHVPLATLGATYHAPQPVEKRGEIRRGQLLLWLGGLIFAALLFLGTNAFWQWKHVIGSSGGRYFVHRIVIPVPVFTQGDPRWMMDQLGPSSDTLGHAGCALTSAAMVLSSYGIDTDPQRLNQFLNTTGGYTPQGWIYWEKAAALAPTRVEKTYEDLPSYGLIDENLLAGNPVIVRLTLRNGTMHFVVLVGKDGWDYLTQDPARTPDYGIYPLRELTPRIEALRFYQPFALSPLAAVLPATASP